MAWIDDRIWCHPKLTDLSDRAFRAYVNGLAYASGFETGGHLTAGQQRTIGATPRDRKELVFSQLWEENGGVDVVIHGWAEYNAKRDARKAADRLRKRAERQKSAGQSAGQSAGRSRGRSAGQAQDGPQDRRALTNEGSETQELRTSSVSEAMPAKPAVASNDGEPIYAIGDLATQALRQAGRGAGA